MLRNEPDRTRDRPGPHKQCAVEIADEGLLAGKNGRDRRPILYTFGLIHYPPISC